jgi:chromosome segregation ATPase
MNLVIGPNGSGKSTIVCAICLGLGYSPNVLGRASAITDFVQHGKDTAEIEIELAGENETTAIVKRRIKKDKANSMYFLNGKQDTLAKVQELMSSFNIQIDNLWYPLK